MEFAYSCGLTEYSTAWLEIWILRSWTAGKGEGKLGELSPEGRWEPMWVAVALCGEWAYRCHARQWRDITLEGRERLEDRENGTREDFCSGQFRKRSFVVARRGAKGEHLLENAEKLVFVPLTSVPKDKKWGRSHLRDHLCQLCWCHLMGEGKKKSNMYVSESSLGLQMLIALGTVCLYTPVGKTSSNTLAQLLT